jgi:hypothetical protein
VRLETFHKNDIFEALTAGGLDPHECELAEDDREVRVVHVPSGSVFTLGGDAGHYTGDRVVGTSTLSWPFAAYTWAMVPEKVERWARDVTRDVDTPDLWAELRREREILASVSHAAGENTPFTRQEKAEIATQLREIKEYVRNTYDLTGEQAEALDASIDELVEASRSSGRRDWKMMLYGTALSAFISGLLPPDGVWNVLTMAVRGLSHFHGWGLPPQLGT